MNTLGIPDKYILPTIALFLVGVGAALYCITPVTVLSMPGVEYKIDPNALPIEGYNDLVDPHDAESFCDRGMARSFIGDVKGAIKDFDQSIKLDPKNSRAYFGRGQAYLDQEENANALKDYNMAVQYDPDNAKYYLARGRSHSYAGDRTRALADYDEGIKLDPKNAELYCARAYVRGLEKNTKGAIDDLNSARKFDKKDAYIPFARGNERWLLKDTKGALEDFNHALALYPDYTNVYCARGRLLNELGEKKLAMKDFDQAIRIAPDDPWPREARSNEREAAGDKAGAAEDKKEAAALEAKEKAKAKKVKKKRFEFITNPVIYKFASDTLVKAQHVFGPAKVPIKRLYIMYRSGKTCQTVMVDEKRGVFCICMANDETADVYYHSLVHELIHLLNTRLADPYIEGLCSAFVDHSTPPARRKFQAWTRQYDRGVVKIPFYAETYIMTKELESKLSLAGISNILNYGTWNKDSKDWQHIDIDAWLKTLDPDKRIIARDIINKYADRIEKTLPDDGAYAFARPSDRGSYKKQWLHKEAHDSRAHNPNPNLLSLPGEKNPVESTSPEQSKSDQPSFESNTRETQPGMPDLQQLNGDPLKPN